MDAPTQFLLETDIMVPIACLDWLDMQGPRMLSRWVMNTVWIFEELQFLEFSIRKLKI